MKKNTIVPMEDAKEYHFIVTEDQQLLIDALVTATDLSKQKLKEALQKGAVWLKQPHLKKVERFRRAKKTLPLGTEVFLYYSATILAEAIQSPQLIADHTDFSVWYKPKGVLCQGSKWADHTTIHRWIETDYQFNDERRKAIIVHRLDKATDGLILIAHNLKTAKAITHAFEKKAIVKRYQAKVFGSFPEKEVLFETPIDQKPAFTRAKRIHVNSESNQSLLEVQIETGRKHQIRRHLSDAGFPIVGDRLYGNSPQTEDLQLTAVFLQIELNGNIHRFDLPHSLRSIESPKYLIH